MSLYQKASLVQIPSGYKASADKLYSVVPNNGDGDFTVSVDADATRVNKDGLIESVVADQARLNYDPTNPQDPHLLLEPTRTNSLPESQNFSTNWAAVGSTVSSGISSPDGGTNAYSLIENAATGGKIIVDTISVSAGSVTYSLFMKKGDKRYTALLLSGVVTTSMLNVDLDNGTVSTATGSFDSTSIEEYPNGWYRISATSTATAGNLNCNVYLMNGATYNDRNYTGNGTDKTYIFGAQLEAGSYPTSYIPTNGSTVTRSADVANNSGNADLFNDSEGVLYANIAALANDLTYRVFGLSDGSTSNRIIFYYNPNSNNIELFISSGGASQTTLSSTLSDIKLFQKVAVKYKSNDIGLWINGFEVGTDTNATMPSGLNEFAFDNSTGAQNFYGKVKELAVFKEALTDAELESLTSWTSFNEMANELNLTIK